MTFLTILFSSPPFVPFLFAIGIIRYWTLNSIHRTIKKWGHGFNYQLNYVQLYWLPLWLCFVYVLDLKNLDDKFKRYFDFSLIGMNPYVNSTYVIAPWELHITSFFSSLEVHLSLQEIIKPPLIILCTLHHLWVITLNKLLIFHYPSRISDY